MNNILEPDIRAEQSKALKKEISDATAAGFYKGTLEGLMLQLRKEGDDYIVSDQVVELVKKSVRNFNDSNE
jgi:hypothetical protein